MKKLSKKMRIVLSLMVFLMPMVTNWFGYGTEALADDSIGQVVIHKKKMTDFPDPLIQNTGKEMSEFDQYQGLADVQFTVYDVSTAFYAERAKGATVDAAKQAVQSLTQGTPVADGTTDGNGNLTISLPKKSDGKDAVYTIKEEAKSGVTAAANMVIAFPVYEMIKQADGSYKYGTQELNIIHIYPKNTVANDGSLQVNKIGTAENESLDGAEFVISKEEGNPSVVKYIEKVKEGLYTWTATKSLAKRFVSGKVYGIGSNDFTEAAGDKGQLIISNLEVGNYVLEEVKAPVNAELIDSQTKTPFEIIADSQTPVQKTVKNDTSKVEKTVPQLEGKDVQIGESIQYEISVNIPLGIADKEGATNKYTKFLLIDKHDEALTFDNVSAGETAFKLFDGTTLIAAENYSVTEQGNGFSVAINPEYIPSLTPGGTLKFIYYMHLNELADPTVGFKNEANVENGHTDDKTPPVVEVVTGGKRFIKVDGDVSAEKTLAGAEFVVRDQVGEAGKYLNIDPITKFVSWTASKSEATIFATSENGLIDVTGLKYGTYYLEETKAPEDYVLLSSQISFTIDEHSYGTTDNLVNPEKVPNKHKGTLPATGGAGIFLYVGLGATLLAIAGVYFARRRKENHA